MEFLRIDAGKQDLRLLDDALAAFQIAELRQAVQRALLRVEHIEDLLRGLRHEAGQQHSGEADALQQVIQHRGQAILLLLILAQHPRRRLIDVFVGAAQQRKDLADGVADTQLVHLLFHLFRRLQRQRDQFIIHRLADLRIGYETAEILVGHRDGPADQIAQDIGQISVHALHHQIPGDRSILGKRHLMQDEVAHGIDAEIMHELIGIDGVALGLGHLAIADQQPRMSEHLLRQRQIQRHEHDRPVDRMETQDVLADDVHIGRPILPEVFRAFSIRVIAQRRDIVAQRVDPDIDDMLRVKVDRDAPFE